MTQQEIRLQLAEIAGTWLAAIAVVVGGLFGVFQYLEHKSAVRVDRTMAFVERYHSDGLLMDARLKISNSTTQHVEQLKIMLTDPSISLDNLPKLYNQQIIEIVEQDSLAGPLDQVFTFYEQIILCRELELCDLTVTAQFFDNDALGFVNTYYPYICDLRAQYNNPEKFLRVTNFYLPSSDSICEL